MVFNQRLRSSPRRREVDAHSDPSWTALWYLIQLCIRARIEVFPPTGIRPPLLGHDPTEARVGSLVEEGVGTCFFGGEESQEETGGMCWLNKTHPVSGLPGSLEANPLVAMSPSATRAFVRRPDCRTGWWYGEGEGYLWCNRVTTIPM